ncbi:HAMP domain-containing sensor histidine kinase [Hamadaea tsunoensis]|uniref:HAMP domain-containing sensor histidine kinase n=1 Tax=Hamadaea tsunoensis TaxID=53368 RepID=UPI0003F6CBD4|nr:ATP-binding protein [Hamadaea tsunoensis]
MSPTDGPVRQRFTLLYAGASFLSGAVLLILVNLLAAAGTGRSRRLLGVCLLLLILWGLSSVAVGWIVAGRVLEPLRTLTVMTRAIGAENLDARLAIAGPDDEVKDLADTIDGLLGRLEASFTAQRRFVANAAHEMRTPLATVRAAVDVAMAKPEPIPDATAVLAARTRTELDRLDRLLDGLLVLARAEHGALADREPLALGGLAGQAIAARADDILARNLTVDASSLHGGRTEGSRILLLRMVENLVDNAIRHNEEGGFLRVATASGEFVRLVVESGGPVLDPVQVSRLGRPFERLGIERTGTGSGLGLSIVTAIVEAHGGKVVFDARPGGGLRVVVLLPRIVQPSRAEPASPEEAR